MLEIRRAKDEDFHRFSLKGREALIRSTAYIAVDNNKIVMEANFRYMGLTHAMVEFEGKENKNIQDKLIQEFLWLSPFVKSIFVDGDMIFNENAREIKKVLIDELIPNQYSIAQSKYNNVKSWLSRVEELVVGAFEYQNNFYVIDGHSRLKAAKELGMKECFIYEEQQTPFFVELIDWCREKGVANIDDVVINPDSVHQIEWIDRCQEYLKKHD